MQQNQFYSNGKLLLSGEYFVLHGAKALAIPLKFGQYLNIEFQPNNISNTIHWESYENDLLWFEMQISVSDFAILKTSDFQIANNLTAVLQKAKKINSNFLSSKQWILVQSNLSFNKEWGLGSSSTLINNIAKWAEVNPYKLLKHTFGGSGYDIACADASQAIFYTKLKDGICIDNANFNPEFSNNLFFIYLGKKQNSAKSIDRFNQMEKPSIGLIKEISDIGTLMAQTNKLSEFNESIINHENILSSSLKIKPVKQAYFSNFDGEIKSLGAWGGDFILATTNSGFSYVEQYFEKHKLDVIFKYSDLIK